MLGEIGYLALIEGASQQQTHLMGVEIARRAPAFKDRDFIPLARVLPARVTLRRMIDLAKHPAMAQTIAAQRPGLEAFANTINESSGQARSPAEEGRKLLDLAKSNASMERLYEAAISLGFADGLSAYVQSLDDLRKSWALTDVQQEQYRKATEYLDTCLAEAGRQLGLAGEFPVSSSASDGTGEAIIRVWKETQNPASQASSEDGIHRR